MVRPIRTILVEPALPPELERLRDLGYNLRWSWDHETIELFRRLDRELWEATGHNPVRMLGAIRQERLNEAVGNPGFRAQLERCAKRLDDYLGERAGTWFAQHGPIGSSFLVAYFSAEFGLTDCLPIYSGGLGVLAGDHLKSASDLGVPLVGLGLAYQKGYFRQVLNADGWQGESYPINDFYTMPLQLERDAGGQPLTIEVPFPGRSVRAQVWRVQVGRVPLYLMDTNISTNRAEDQDITDQLYGGDNEMRIKQEILLGIGGVRVLQALGIDASVYHINEGHAAFSTLERIRLIMQRQNVSFEVAMQAASRGSVFTTHTPVPAGIDKFDVDLIDRYLGSYYEWLGITREQFLALGRVDANNWQEPFNMAILANRLATLRNGVSRLHGEVSRSMWRELWPRVPDEEIPITSITNGIHLPSWLSIDMAALYDRYMGPGWREEQSEDDIWSMMEQVPAEELWRTHERRRERLVAVARRRLRDQMARRDAPQSEMLQAGEALNPKALTIGFARRFATYKRATLLFRDLERLHKIVNAPERPVQIIFAGKAHPADNPGRDLIRQLVHYSRQEDFRGRIIFLDDYDMNLARYLLAGVDVWLNTPRRPREASGTSGMKAAANGVLNLSVLDGWWDEAYQQDVGWAIGHGEEYDDEAYHDYVESNALYDLLEKEVIPTFYERGADGLPRRWIAHMRAAIATLAPQFNTHRMVREYSTRLYFPAFASEQRMCGDSLQRSIALTDWLKPVQRLWSQIWIRDVRADNADDPVRVGQRVKVTAEIYLGEIRPQDVAAQLYYGEVDADRGIMNPLTVPMSYVRAQSAGLHEFAGDVVSPTSGRFGYTVRVLPQNEDLAEPILPGLITWAS